MIRRGQILRPSSTINTHKYSIVNSLLYIVCYATHVHIKILSIPTEYARYTETQDSYLVRDLLHKLCSCNVLTQILIFLTLSNVLFLSKTPSFLYFKYNVSETGFYLRLQDLLRWAQSIEIVPISEKGLALSIGPN
jgi:hypothetical protein